MEKRKKRNGRGVRWIAALLLSALLVYNKPFEGDKGAGL